MRIQTKLNSLSNYRLRNSKEAFPLPPNLPQSCPMFESHVAR